VLSLELRDPVLHRTQGSLTQTMWQPSLEQEPVSSIRAFICRSLIPTSQPTSLSTN